MRKGKGKAGSWHITLQDPSLSALLKKSSELQKNTGGVKDCSNFGGGFWNGCTAATKRPMIMERKNYCGA